MINSYLIQWKSTVNGRAGKGTKLFDFEEASRLAAELNREYPAIHHEVVKAGSPPEKPEPPERAQPETEPSEVVTELSRGRLRPDFAMSN